MEGGYNNVIYLGSMSKTVAPGLRIGWVVGPSAVIQRLADAKEQMDLGTSAISQELARTFIESEWTTHIKKLMGIRKKILFVPGGLYGAQRGGI